MHRSFPPSSSLKECEFSVYSVFVSLGHPQVLEEELKGI